MRFRGLRRRVTSPPFGNRATHAWPLSGTPVIRAKMKSLTIDELHDLRNAIFENAESFYKEAKCLHANGFFARSFLLAYFTVEELGKLPMVAGAIGTLQRGEVVEWGKLKRRFTTHERKIKSAILHHYLFGIDPSLFNDDFEWYEAELKKVGDIYQKKNEATYVDVANGQILNPLVRITKEDSERAVAKAFDALQAHWISEAIFNPKHETK